MKQLYILQLFFVLSSVIILSSCASMLPVNGQYEHARALGKGNVEISGHFTSHLARLYENTGTTNNNFGFRAGYGLTNRFDLKLRYEKLAFTRHFDGRLRAAQFVSITPKFAVIPGHFSIYVPVGRYYANYEAENNKYTQKIGSVSPYLMYSMTAQNNKFDLSAHLKTDFIYELDGDGDSNMFLGAGLGAGFSRDLRKWAIRPEVGISSDGSGTYWNYGIGLQFILQTKRK